MSADCFIDANVLLYARQKEITPKVERAIAWLRFLASAQRDCTNLQVLNEMTHVLLRKRKDLTTHEVFVAIDELRPLGTAPISEDIAMLARRLRLTTSYSWWDCLLLASAIDLKCRYFLSEDMQDGQAIEGLTIINPFLHTADKILA
ncbi:PIN domain-containing protein [Brucella sp. IR073]|uniref:PIN domain-containing protein n=1 Tax=unclassified Brucella TaxID=2632610 RepID=UPI003B984E92